MALAVLARKMFGSANDRKLKAYRGRIEAINALEPEIEALTDDQLRLRTDDFRQQIAGGATLDDLLVPAFATVREAAKRTLKQRHFDVQLCGGLVLHDGRIAEMKTGEGKTLVATLPVYLNALAGHGVHVVTVNDYLAKRDAEWMGQIYRFLGLSVDTIVHGLDDDQRRAAYDADVTYGTNNEFGFDYLRDNMKMERRDMVQRGHFYAIVDEVDSILIDEARTPLIISGPLEDKSELYNTIDRIIPELVAEDYELDEKLRNVTFTEAGTEHAERLLETAGLLNGASLYDTENVTIVHHINQALRAHTLFERDRDYIVRNDEIVIIDEFTGRMMPGRRYSEGQHQALEAKEGVTVQPENQTLASITFQNYFRLYDKLSGMTGTASTEADELMDIYKLDVIEVPTNVAVARIDEDDEVYRTREEKYNAIVSLIRECQDRRQPVLVGTTSIEKSEHLAKILTHEKVSHQVLNARHHEREASIIAQAGVPGAVTIATNMAGRGTDIQLGGNVDMRLAEELAGIEDESARQKKAAQVRQQHDEMRQQALKAGGLFVLATERHEARRIDNQLRGRSGRQGDPGTSKFFLSLEDDLMRIFGSQRMDSVLVKLGLEEGEAIVHPWINKAIERAQGKVEARNFDIRKNLLKFDDVMNDQRKVIFEQRLELMSDDNLADTVKEMRHSVIEDLVAKSIPARAYAEQWDAQTLQTEVEQIFALDLPVTQWAAEEGMADEEIRDRLIRRTDEAAAAKAARFGPELTRQIEKAVLLQTLDHMWREHLATLDHLRQVIGLRAHGQRDPLNEYKTEGFNLFEALLSNLRQVVTGQLFHIEVAPDQETLRSQEMPEMHEERPGLAPGDLYEEDDHLVTAAPADRSLEATGYGLAPVRSRKAADHVDRNDPSTWGKVGRNEPCPCGSGKKYKHCHGRLH